ncbi:hypothetical protein M3D15_06840 [Pseudoclavibacter alba]|uniref:Uncharacterized protein n=1 Tax=Pseudoclavibacter albus TaxID=272241 RepID=A0ABT2HXK5_9MICO|nr:hypothetical protein [Pseudoclavibacter alba]MCT2043047.1 hypothetical protein [Pseudoclavibacter alba]
MTNERSELRKTVDEWSKDPRPYVAEKDVELSPVSVKDLPKVPLEGADHEEE